MLRPFLEYIVNSVIDFPTHLVIDIANPAEQQYAIIIKVHGSDMGKLIGRDGKTIKSLRNLAQMVADPGTIVSFEVQK
ncbi:KH domain-containing protein [Vermiphilus pyriformis]|jgi:predicted RNA-binding protein YlqC (UPF0109 family)|uniref:Uncharacterized protein n=1 Tax=candidate division TM6 bacterium JCVI TM6SC1 TaxID=1306947 RepID=A0A0D2K4X8_9BACT|nr:hypothetical protein J120_03020 [candidate division TM6 bacterium JCVI TM6SC1]UNE35322.1 MAG: KH domain-containing protein [Vermiphilus pyriformis]